MPATVRGVGPGGNEEKGQDRGCVNEGFFSAGAPTQPSAIPYGGDVAWLVTPLSWLTKRQTFYPPPP